MSVGTGIECINLKKAKYNRDMRLAKAAETSGASREVQDSHAAGRVNTAGIRNGAYGASHTRSADIPENRLTLKDVLDAVKDDIDTARNKHRIEKMREKAREPRYIIKKVEAKTAFPVSIIGYIVVFSVIAMFLVLGNSRINEANLYAGSLEKQINEAMHKYDMLTAEINSRNDAASVESYALDVLGLVKKTDVAKTYVSISGEDKVVVSGNEADLHIGGAVTMTLDSAN